MKGINTINQANTDKLWEHKKFNNRDFYNVRKLGETKISAVASARGIIEKE